MNKSLTILSLFGVILFVSKADDLFKRGGIIWDNYYQVWLKTLKNF